MRRIQGGSLYNWRRIVTQGDAAVTKCPQKRVIVDEATSSWDEFAQYSSCSISYDNAGSYVTLSNPKICDNGNCRCIRPMGLDDSIVTSQTNQFCKEF